MMIEPNKEILAMIDDYNHFMNSSKKVETPIVVSKPKINHKTSLYSESMLIADYPLGNSYFTCEVRNGNKKDCSLQIISNAIKKVVLFRYDSNGPTHKNSLPHIPLSEQIVTTPHFHKYDNNGFFIAYKTDLLKDSKHSIPLRDIEFGFPYFCQEGNITSVSSEELPTLQVIKEGELPFDYDDIDPLDGIIF